MSKTRAKTKAKAKTRPKRSRERRGRLSGGHISARKSAQAGEGPVLVISTGCPAGVGPEISVVAASGLERSGCVLVGSLEILKAAAQRRRVKLELLPFQGSAKPGKVYVLDPGPRLGASDRTPGKPSVRAGRAQLAYVNAAYALCKQLPNAVMVSAPVNKAAINRSGADGAERFTGHTEWLADLDGAKESIMSFVCEGLATSLVTTHSPLSDVPKLITPARVASATVWLARVLRASGCDKPHLAVCSLNPHAGEQGLFGDEEAKAIVPGIKAAARQLGNQAEISGPLGAETAYRKAYAGAYDGVVAMYHDQATIPMKLVAFGTSVNVTLGLSIVRTSVDHGTAYDVAWSGRASPGAMVAAVQVAERLAGQGLTHVGH
jgi:4-hydroxythreonine-4-phosphate dehydrogenase